MDKTVGMIGLGIMGGAIARNLVERGWRVIGYDTDAARARRTGAGQRHHRRRCRSGRARRADHHDQPSHPAPRSKMSRRRSPVPASRRGSWSNSRRSPSPTSFASKPSLKKAGHIALDCPLSGTGAQAKNRDLIVYASGDSAAIARCTDLFADFAKQSADLGAFGNGSRMKFVANHLVAIHNVATAEAMILAERAGLDPKMVVEMVGPGAGGSRMFQMRAPMMVEGVYEPATMKVSTWKKDMAIIAEFADDVGCATPLFTLTQPVYTAGDGDGTGRPGHRGGVRGAEEDHRHDAQIRRLTPE